MTTTGALSSFHLKSFAGVEILSYENLAKFIPTSKRAFAPSCQGKEKKKKEAGFV
jgi:hypothetical protein